MLSIENNTDNFFCGCRVIAKADEGDFTETPVVKEECPVHNDRAQELYDMWQQEHNLATE